MVVGGNNRAHVFFKQHGWTNDEKIEAKYTSQAAHLYRQILAEEAIAEETNAGLPEAYNEVSSSYAVKEELPPPEHEATGVTSLTKASNTVVPSTFKKPIGATRTGKTGGLGARKLTTKPKDNLYEQKPEEVAPVIPASSSTNNGGSKSSAGSSFASRFGYNDDFQSGGQSGGGGGTQVLNHVAPPKPSSSFFADLGMESAFTKESSSSSSKVQVEESDEARKKFSNAKSISSAQFFGDEDISKSTLDELSETKDMWLSLIANKAGTLKEKLVAIHYRFDIYGFRRDMTELMETIYGPVGDSIPFATRENLILEAHRRITSARHLTSDRSKRFRKMR